LADSRSDITEIPNEVPAALRCAPDPAKLVLQTLEGFYPAGNGGELCRLQRYACNLLLESLPFVLSPDEVSSEAKKDAQKIAAAWKSKHSVNPEYPTNTQEAKAFLHLLVSYGISKEFKDDDLCELVLCISQLPKVHELCHALQITHTIPGWWILPFWFQLAFRFSLIFVFRQSLLRVTYFKLKLYLLVPKPAFMTALCYKNVTVLVTHKNHHFYLCRFCYHTILCIILQSFPLSQTFTLF
jgi:hypothetical protein